MPKTTTTTTSVTTTEVPISLMVGSTGSTKGLCQPDMATLLASVQDAGLFESSQICQ